MNAKALAVSFAPGISATQKQALIGMGMSYLQQHMSDAENASGHDGLRPHSRLGSTVDQGVRIRRRRRCISRARCGHGAALRSGRRFAGALNLAVTPHAKP